MANYCKKFGQILAKILDNTILHKVHVHIFKIEELAKPFDSIKPQEN